MIKFTKTVGVYFFVTIAFCFVQILIHKYSIKNEINKEIMELQYTENKTYVESEPKTEIWQIEIPKISLKANISEGTTSKIINQYIGHFENTSKEQGNIGLATNSRDLKLLKKGDEIKYTYNKFEKIYKVEKCRIIKDTELYYLEETEENMITLITYVENQTEYRRCIQAIEKEDDMM